MRIPRSAQGQRSLLSPTFNCFANCLLQWWRSQLWYCEEGGEVLVSVAEVVAAYVLQLQLHALL